VSFDGRRVLIPAGTKLIGDYRSGITVANQNLRRMDKVAPEDGVSVQLGRSARTISAGRAGRLRRPALCRALRRIDPPKRRRGASQFIATLGQQSSSTINRTRRNPTPIR